VNVVAVSFSVGTYILTASPTFGCVWWPSWGSRALGDWKEAGEMGRKANGHVCESHCV